MSQISDPSLPSFFAANPGFDLATFNFLDTAAVNGLTFADRPTELPKLKAYQRLLRVLLQAGESEDDADRDAQTLMTAGLSSAHAISSMTQKQFVHEQAPALAGGEAAAKAIHRNAVGVTGQAMHLWANAQSVTAPHFKALAVNNVHPALTGFFEGLPSYQEMFGSLDYCDCCHCRSIFGPAAYFVDILRITEKYITSDPDNSIETGRTLLERRPDLGEMLLTCDNTNRLVPYLQIVNDVLADTVRAAFPGAVIELGLGVREAFLGAELRPFNLPNNLSLLRLRAYLTHLNVELGDVLEVLAAREPLWRERAGLYKDSEDVVTRSLTGGDTEALRKNMDLVYGTDSYQESRFLLSSGLDRPRMRELFYQNLSEDELNAGLADQLFINDGSATWNRVNGGLKQVSAVDSQTAWGINSSDEIWRTNDGGATWNCVNGGLKQVSAVDSQTAWGVNFSDEILRTSDGGATWNRGDGRLKQVSAVDSQTAWSVNSSDEIWRTTDGGATWGRCDGLLKQVSAVNSQTAWGVTSGDAIYRTTDGGATWGRCDGLLMQVSAVDSQTAWGVTSGDTIYRTNDGGATWWRLGGAALKQISAVDPQSAWGVNSLDETWRTNDGGATWNRVSGALKQAFAVDIAYGPSGATLEGLNLFTQDRMHRFIRLSNFLGWTFEQLDWALRSLGAASTDITTGTIQQLGMIRHVAETEGIPVVELCAYWADMKTTGVGDPAAPEDPFDRVFNNPAVLGGAPPYHPEYAGNPLYTDPVVTLSTGTPAGGGAFEHSRIRAALGISASQLNELIDGVWGGTVDLDVPNLSVLYRLSRILDRFGLTLAEYRVLLRLGNWLEVLTQVPIATYIELSEAVAWIRQSGLTAYQLDYIVNGTPDPSVAVNRPATWLETFAKSLWTHALPTLTTPGAFAHTHVDAEASAKIFDALVAAQALTDVTRAYEEQAGLVPPAPKLALVTARAATLTAEEFLTLLSNVLPLASEAARVKDRLERQREAQQALVRHMTGALLGQAEDLAGALLDFSAKALKETDYVQLLLTPVTTEGAGWPRFVSFMQQVDRTLALAVALGLNHTELSAITYHPSAFNIADIALLTVDDVHRLYESKRLQRAFGDTHDAFVTYLVTDHGDSQPVECASSQQVGRLEELTGWPRAQICALVKHFSKAGLFAEEAETYGTAQGLLALQKCFEVTRKTGLSVETLISFVDLVDLEVAGSPGNSGGNSYLFAAAADRLRAAVAARYTPGQWPAVRKKIESPLLALERDLLAGLALVKVNWKFPDVTNLRQLSEFLLIDLQMTGCSEISYLKQALLSVQTYMHRCRLRLEPGVEDVDIPRDWWQWIMNYRVWEANRKVFLYPENYLDPSLRQDASDLYAQLQNDLLRTDVTAEAVDSAFLEYMDSFSQLANLRIAGAYRTDVKSPGLPAPVDTLFLFGRTHTEPYAYYCRRCEWPDEAKPRWTPWEKIGLKVDAPDVTPCYAFNRVFLFWVEPAKKTLRDTDNKAIFSCTASIKYSFHNLSGKWAPPQTLAKDIVTSFDDFGRSYLQNLLFKSLYDLEQVVWNKVLAIALPQRPDRPEQLIVLFGGFLKILAEMHPEFSLPDLPNVDHPDRASFLESLSALQSNYERLYSPGIFLAASPAIVVDANLHTNQKPVALQRDGDLDQKLLYKGVLDPGKLGVSPSTNTVWDAYSSESSARHPRVPDSQDDSDRVNEKLDLLSKVNNENAAIQPVKNQPGYFLFDNGDEQFLVAPVADSSWDFRRLSDSVELETTDHGYNLLKEKPYRGQGNFQNLKVRFVRLSTGAITRLEQLLFEGGVDLLLDVTTQQPVGTPRLPFSRFNPSTAVAEPPLVADGDSVDFAGAYGQYFWEIFFHTPFLVAERLRNNQQFEAARKWYHFIFNPTEPHDDGLPPQAPPTSRFWRFQPFRTATSLESLLDSLSDQDQIGAYQRDPFDPHAIARLRIGAYEKAIVMHYVDNLLDWGDNLFTRYTWESITEATLLYMVAYDLLGPRPQSVGPCPAQEPVSFNDIKTRFGTDVPDFLIDMEHAAGNGSPGPPAQGGPFNDVGASYFCVPENEQLIGYWDRVEDRLNKIRHCLNIAGVAEPLALFEPPIDPMQLVRAAAAGQSPLTATAQLGRDVPSHRFHVLMPRARSMVSTLTQLGGALLSALEKQDAERLAVLRNTQEQTLLQLNLQVRQRQIDEAQANLDALQSSLKAATDREQYYAGLIHDGIDSYEQAHMALVADSLIAQGEAVVLHYLSTVGHLLPNIYGLADGGMKFGDAIAAGAQVAEGVGGILSQGAQLSLTVGEWQRREAEWQFQQRLAADDLDQINHQIQAAGAGLEIARHQMAAGQKSIDQNREIDAFLNGKFTNQQLYQWMVGRLSVVYFQTYQLALDMALSAQRAYQFERNTNDTFINFDYWDSTKKGLLAGEALNLALDQLDRAYLERDTRPLEIEKTVSLLELDPKALYELKATGSCSFQLGEKLFDFDYPGHYARQIRTISISIPALLGPYQNFKATLTQTVNRTVLIPDTAAVGYLLNGSGAQPLDSVLRVNWRANQQVAISGGLNDHGLFELDFHDDRYLPFEGTGAVSDWQLSIPPETNAFDFNALSDVIVHLRYTARFDGGLRAWVISALSG